MLQPLAPGVLRWTTTRPSASRPGVIYEFAGFAVAFPGTLGVILVDPPALTQADCSEIEALGTPTHILLTCEWHTRAAAHHRDRWGCRVLMHPAGHSRAEISIDGPLHDDALLWDAIRVIHIPDVYYAEEVALLVEPPEVAGRSPLLIVGDALSGGRDEQGIPAGEVALHAPRYVADFARAHDSLLRLLDLAFDAAAFGHGSAIVTGARAAIERCLRSDVAWLASAGREGSLARLAAWPDQTLYHRYLEVADERARGVPALSPD